MDKKVVFMFSGQGSQYYNMGKKLYTHNKIFRDMMCNVNDIVYRISGYSVLDKVYEEGKQSSQAFDRTIYTHPAIFMVQYSLAQALLQSGIEPNYVLGMSMGEFVSAALSGVMDLEDIMETILMQAETFESYCEPGGMLAILGDPKLYRTESMLYEDSELVAVNFHTHFVVSGKIDKLHKISEFLRSKGIANQKLPVSFAFHSALLEPAASKMQNFLRTKTCKDPKIPFVSCLYGDILKKLPNNYFWSVVREPMEFMQAIRKIENCQENIYVDLGPSGTLANFAKYNLPEYCRSQVLAVITPFNQELENLEKVKALVLTK